MDDEAAQAGISKEELEKKRQARLERFGKESLEDSEKSISKKRGDGSLGEFKNFKPNRRK